MKKSQGSTKREKIERKKRLPHPHITENHPKDGDQSVCPVCNGLPEAKERVLSNHKKASNSKGDERKPKLQINFEQTAEAVELAKVLEHLHIRAHRLEVTPPKLAIHEHHEDEHNWAEQNHSPKSHIEDDFHLALNHLGRKLVHLIEREERSRKREREQI